ncbi:DUF3265 domain-containing protein [Vibrio diazotrophicus]|nr:DUF3265 domain-containing protein [Vibrio diazotrophicus]
MWYSWRLKTGLTNNLRVIQYAWHFWFRSILVIKEFKLGVVVTCFTP